MYNAPPFQQIMAYLLEKIKQITGKGASQEPSLATKMPSENREHEEMLAELSTKTKQNTDHMSLENNDIMQDCSIYDGDTMHVVFKEFGSFIVGRVELLGNTPELRTRNEHEKALGYKVRDILREKLLDIVKLNVKNLINMGAC